MTPKALHDFLLSLPATTHTVQWGDDHVYKVGGKMFAVTGVESAVHRISFKAGPDSFDILTRADGIVPAPYLARALWVQVQKPRALSDREMKAYLTRAHGIVAAGLTKKARTQLGLA